MKMEIMKTWRLRKIPRRMKSRKLSKSFLYIVAFLRRNCFCFGCVCVFELFKFVWFVCVF